MGTYTRGTGRLEDGEARILLNESFKWVTNPDIGLTAHLTPRGEWTELYVVSLTTEELVVASKDPDSDSVFDYLVHGLRIGFEESSVIREKWREAHIPSMASHHTLYEKYPELRRFNALERFKAMRTAIGKTEPVDLSEAHALRDAITVYDPEKHRTQHSPRPGSVQGSADRIEDGPAGDTFDRPERPAAHAELRYNDDTGIEALRDRIATLETLVSELTEAQEDR